MEHSFDLKWNFCTTRSSGRLTCNRVHRQGLVKNMIRNTKSITCGCDWSIRFKGNDRSNKKNSDPVIITCVCGDRSIMCDPSYVDQFVLTQTRSSDYKHCADQCLKKIMVQIAIDPFINVRTMVELLHKALPNRKIIDKYMINNIRICTRERKLELDYENIDIDPKYFDTSYITSYQDTADNHSKGKSICAVVVSFVFILYVNIRCIDKIIVKFKKG